MKSSVQTPLIIAIMLFQIVLTLDYDKLSNLIKEADPKTIDNYITRAFPTISNDKRQEVNAYTEVILAKIEARIIAMKEVCEIKKNFEENVNYAVDYKIVYFDAKEIEFNLHEEIIKVKRDSVQNEIKDQKYQIESSCEQDKKIKYKDDIKQIDSEIEEVFKKINDIVPHTKKLLRRRRTSYGLIGELFQYFGIDKYIKGTVIDSEGRKALLLIIALAAICIVLWIIIAIVVWVFTHILIILLIMFVVGVAGGLAYQFLWKH